MLEVISAPLDTAEDDNTSLYVIAVVLSPCWFEIFFFFYFALIHIISKYG